MTRENTTCDGNEFVLVGEVEVLVKQLQVVALVLTADYNQYKYISVQQTYCQFGFVRQVSQKFKHNILTQERGF